MLNHLLALCLEFSPIDIIECLENPCASNASCTNTVGSYQCECDDGFTGSGWNCSGEIDV